MSTQANTRIGRPRANQHPSERPVQDEILHVARQLFREKGFAGTTTREIASAAGLRQPSLFHYFKNKEAIFRAVAFGTVEPVLAFIKEEKAVIRSTATAMHRLIWFDTYHLCTDENVLVSPALLHELTREEYPEFWKSRDRIINAYRKLIKNGVQEKVFDVKDVEIATNFIFSLGESTITWYQPENSKKTPEKIADSAASLGLKALLIDNSLLDAAESESGASAILSKD